jgi:hypothetical protein
MALPGVAVRAAVTAVVFQPAVISDCGRYRYVLTRRVGSGARIATFILLNPSTADGTRDDPTIRRCIGFTRAWDCGQLVVLNLFALRSPSPAVLKRAEAPAGSENRKWFEQVLAGRPRRGLGPIVCGWGTHGEHRDQDRVVLGWLDEFRVRPLAFGLTKDGHPRHPLYLPAATELIPFDTSGCACGRVELS